MKNNETIHSASCSRFASRMNAMPRSCIRELLSNANPDLISFGGGVPHERCVPIDAIREAFDATLARHGADAFSYGASEGETALREFVAYQWLPRLGCQADPGDILIVNGSQQALDLLGKVLLDRGSCVAVERPTYVAALQAFGAFEPRFIDVALTSDGIDVGALHSALKRDAPKLFYAIPSFQNPSGVCYSEENRRNCLATLSRSNCVLVEDDPYSELYYDVKPPRPMCALGDGDAAAVLLGTFSKTVAPGFRLGWIWAKGELRRNLVTAKQAADLCTGRFQQFLLLETLLRLDIDRHLEQNRLFYEAQRDRMQKCLKKHLNNHAAWNVPAGGMFFWLHLSSTIDCRTLLAACIEHGVAFADGRSFHAGDSGAANLRLNFTRPSAEDMEKGILRLAEAIGGLQL